METCLVSNDSGECPLLYFIEGTCLILPAWRHDDVSDFRGRAAKLRGQKGFIIMVVGFAKPKRPKKHLHHGTSTRTNCLLKGIMVTKLWAFSGPVSWGSF